MILKNMLIFAIFAIVGWIIEVIYRSIINKKFINPGFLTGCVVPLYGVGTVIINSICNIFDKIESNYKLLLIVVVSTIILTILELITGIVMLKLFNVKLWDYSDEKLNYKGLICLKFSLAWGILVILFYLTIYPHLNNIIVELLTKTITLLLLGAFYGIFLVDFCVSIDFFSKVLEYSKAMKKIVNLEALKLESLKKSSIKIWNRIYPYKQVNKFLKDKIKNNKSE